MATDELMKKVPGFAGSGLKGYVVEREEGGFVLTFYGEGAGGLEAAHLVHVAGGRAASSATLRPGQRSC